jgi:hypothetical protein
VGASQEHANRLAGPLSPDCWDGQTLIPDHADIFAFRFLSIAAA